MSEWIDDAEEMVNQQQQDQAKLGDTTNWNPEEGDILAGTLLEGKIVPTKYGDTHVMFVEDADEKVWMVWCGNTTLKNALLSQAPKPGNGVSIKFDGMKKATKPGGNDYKAFYLACEASDHEYWLEVAQTFAMKQQEANMGSGQGREAGPAPDPSLSDPF